MLVVTKFVILADGADKNTSAVKIWPSIVEPVIFPEAVMFKSAIIVWPSIVEPVILPGVFKLSP